MSWFLIEYICVAGHRSESLEERARPSRIIPCETCNTPAVRCISAVKSRTVWACAGAKGKPDPAPCPTATNTIPMGEGQSRKAWKADRAKIWRDYDRARRRAKGAPV